MRAPKENMSTNLESAPQNKVAVVETSLPTRKKLPFVTSAIREILMCIFLCSKELERLITLIKIG